MKYYATTLFKHFPEIVGDAKTSNQYRIVCKAKSRADANRQAEALGLRQNTFSSDYTGITGNSIEIAAADQYGFVICIGDEYLDIKTVLKNGEKSS